MILTIPDKVSWKKNIVQNSLTHYSTNIAKRIHKTHTHAERDAITYEILPLSHELLGWFSPLYREKIAQKNSPLVIDLYAEALENKKRDYYILIISEDGKRTGGVIYSETATVINIAYKIFEDTWFTSTLPASPSLYADFLLTEHGRETGRQHISHGKDRNGYGKTSSIGLAIFKISLGYKPYLPKTCTLLELDTATISCDSLYFSSTAETPELSGHLFTTPESRHKWERLDSYREHVSIMWILR